jgi:RNA recognition motif-containing protein
LVTVSFELFGSSNRNPKCLGFFHLRASQKEQHMPKLYIGNLSYSATTEDLEALFSRVGKVESAAVVSDKFSGRSKGFGFVEMADSNDAASAIESLNDSEFQGRRIKVAEARSGEQRGNGNGGGGGGYGNRASRPGGGGPGGGRGGNRRW